MEASIDSFGVPSNPTRRLDPAQYFLVLANYVGHAGQGVAVDRSPSQNEIWNVAVAGYRFGYPSEGDYLGADPSLPGRYRVRVKSTLWWVNNSVSASASTPDFAFGPDSMEYSSASLWMTLELDAPVVFDRSGKITQSGNIVGGYWLGDSQASAPKLMWAPFSVAHDPLPEDGNRNPEIDLEWVLSNLIR
jgi:hypothetical protein